MIFNDFQRFLVIFLARAPCALGMGLHGIVFCCHWLVAALLVLGGGQKAEFDSECQRGVPVEDLVNRAVHGAPPALAATYLERVLAAVQHGLAAEGIVHKAGAAGARCEPSSLPVGPTSSTIVLLFRISNWTSIVINFLYKTIE